MSWYACSISLSVYNKWLFGNRYKSFHFPLFVTGGKTHNQFVIVQNIIQFFLSFLILWLWYPHMRPSRIPSRKRLPFSPCLTNRTIFSHLSMRYQYWTGYWPLKCIIAAHYTVFLHNGQIIRSCLCALVCVSVQAGETYIETVFPP